MHHDTPLISTIVAGLVLAFIFGMIANRFKMPPLVGYLFAGVLVGPHTPGFVADQALGAELAEIGVILLMFGVGLHFSLKDLMSVRALAIPGAIVQIAFATLLGAGLGLLLGWELGASLLFGLALSVASTVVLLKALQDRRLIESERGRIAVGWLIVEDLAMVLALVLIPAIAGLSGIDTGVHDPFVSFVERLVGGSVGIWGVLGLTLIKVAAFVGFMLVVGRRVIPWALHGTAHTGSRELFRLAVLAIALGVALGSAVLFGVSLALGAFFAGMILSESELSHRAAQETLPLRDAFAVLFFVSVGMLFDPSIIITDPLPVLGTVFIIVIGKSLAAFGIVLLFKRPVGTALTISASLAQIGEFSFILASLGVSLAILPPEGQDLILAGALISIVLNPVVFWAVDLAKPRLEARVAARRGVPAETARVEPGEISMAARGPATTDAPTQASVDRGALGADDDTGEPSTLSGHTVLVGYGQVGRIVADGISADGGKLVVIEDSDHDVAAARAKGFEVVFGNAASVDTLRLANMGAARNLLIAISNGFEAGSVCEVGRKLNPSISIIARAYSEEEESFLRGLGASTVIRGEREIGKGILAFLRQQGEPVATVPMDAPKLPEAENILAREAAPLVAAAAVVTEVADEGAVIEPVVSDAVVVADVEPRVVFEPVTVPVEPSTGVVVAEVAVVEAVEPVLLAAPEAETVAEVMEPQDLVVLAAVEAAPVSSDAFEVPPAGPDAETAEAATLESVATTPAVGEAPAEIDEVVVVPPPVEVETVPDAPEPVVETEPADGQGDIVPEDEVDADKPPVVPPVLPEPKG